MKRTYCGTLRAGSIGREVVLSGWVWRRRDHGGVVFLDVRDVSGVCQVVCNPERLAGAFTLAEQLRSEFVVRVTGEVAERPEGTVNLNLPTGEVEVLAKQIEILNHCDPLPFSIEDDEPAGEEARLKYRYLDLRRPTMLKTFQLRSRAYQATRRYLDAMNFIEVETPVLTKSTPEGARDFLVPSRLSLGEFYALPQSPQLFKQLLMVSGFDRYFQIVKCFRDEDLRADRQPEFTQLDMEMSFIEEPELFEIIEGLIAEIWVEILREELPRPFRHMTWHDSMSRYGVDKPDTRFGVEIINIAELAARSDFNVFKQTVAKGGTVAGLCLPGCGSFSRSQIDELVPLSQSYGAKGLAWFKVTESGLESNLTKFFTPELQQEIISRMFAQAGDLVVFVADKWEVTQPVLGRLRLELAKRQGWIPKGQWNFLWITDFPMFEPDENGNPTPMHHPFTSFFLETEDQLEKDPFHIRSRSYDLVLNGVELGSGSIRIHRRDMQEKVFKMLGIDAEQAQLRFGFLLEAFRYGAPPHGGFAFGFDRTMALLVGADSIRDVIAFPKTQRGICTLTQAPSPVDAGQLRELGIELAKDLD